jgi:hypothetical protein
MAGHAELSRLSVGRKVSSWSRQAFSQKVRSAARTRTSKAAPGANAGKVSMT